VTYRNEYTTSNDDASGVRMTTDQPTPLSPDMDDSLLPESEVSKSKNRDSDLLGKCHIFNPIPLCTKPTSNLIFQDLTRRATLKPSGSARVSRLMKMMTKSLTKITRLKATVTLLTTMKRMTKIKLAIVITN
jgi:hypothetical protein